MTRPGSGAGRATDGLFYFAIQMAVAGRHLGPGNRFELLIAQGADRQGLPCPPLQPPVFVDRQHDDTLAAVAGNRDRLSQGLILIAAEMPLKFD
jgi:hypothetical protein